MNEKLFKRMWIKVIHDRGVTLISDRKEEIELDKEYRLILPNGQKFRRQYLKKLVYCIHCQKYRHSNHKNISVKVVKDIPNRICKDCNKGFKPKIKLDQYLTPSMGDGLVERQRFKIND